MRILLLVLLIWTKIVIGQTSIVGGISARSPDLILNSQNITISPEKIKVISEYINQADHDLTETFVFTNPLNINVDTLHVHTQLMQYALNTEGKDISLHLAALGLPFDPIAAMQIIDASSNRDSIIGKLLALYLIDVKESIPNWTVKNYYYWQHTFPAGGNVVIEHNYKPTVAVRSVKLNTITSMLKAPINVMKKAVNIAVHWNLDDNVAANNIQAQLERYISNINSYCPNSIDYRAIATAQQLKKNQKPQLETKSLNFRYNSDDLWSKPLDHFVLTIDSTDNMYPVLCWHDKMQRNSNNTLRFSAENYVPMQDISVLYIEK